MMRPVSLHGTSTGVCTKSRTERSSDGWTPPPKIRFSLPVSSDQTAIKLPTPPVVQTASLLLG